MHSVLGDKRLFQFYRCRFEQLLEVAGGNHPLVALEIFGIEETLDFSRHCHLETILIYRDRERNVQGKLSERLSQVRAAWYVARRFLNRCSSKSEISNPQFCFA